MINARKTIVVTTADKHDVRRFSMEVYGRKVTEVNVDGVEYVPKPPVNIGYAEGTVLKIDDESFRVCEHLGGGKYRVEHLDGYVRYTDGSSNKSRKDVSSMSSKQQFKEVKLTKDNVGKGYPLKQLIDHLAAGGCIRVDRNMDYFMDSTGLRYFDSSTTSASKRTSGPVCDKLSQAIVDNVFLLEKVQDKDITIKQSELDELKSKIAELEKRGGK